MLIFVFNFCIELLQFIKNPMNKKLDRKIINNEIIFYLNISKMLSSNNKEKEKKKRFGKKYN